MGIQDREWYQEAQKNKHRKQNSNQWSTTNHNNNNPFNKTTLLYLSLSINVMLGFALYYIV